MQKELIQCNLCSVAQLQVDFDQVTENTAVLGRIPSFKQATSGPFKQNKQTF